MSYYHQMSSITDLSMKIKTCVSKRRGKKGTFYSANYSLYIFILISTCWIQLGKCCKEHLSGHPSHDSRSHCQKPELRKKNVFFKILNMLITPLKSTHGTKYNAGSKFFVSMPSSCKRLEPSSDWAHSSTASGVVEPISSSARQSVEAFGGKREAIRQLMNGTYSSGSVICI